MELYVKNMEPNVKLKPPDNTKGEGGEHITKSGRSFYVQITIHINVYVKKTTNDVGVIAIIRIPIWFVASPEFNKNLKYHCIFVLSSDDLNTWTNNCYLVAHIDDLHADE